MTNPATTVPQGSGTILPNNLFLLYLAMTSKKRGGKTTKNRRVIFLLFTFFFFIPIHFVRVYGDVHAVMISVANELPTIFIYLFFTHAVHRWFL